MLPSAVDLASDDFGREPWGYPGTPTSHRVCVLADDRIIPAEDPDDVLAALRQPAMSERLAVVAVGGARSPVELSRLLRRAAPGSAAVLVADVLSGAGIGVGARPDSNGCLPAAAYLSPAEHIAVTVCWLTKDQLPVALEEWDAGFVELSGDFVSLDSAPAGRFRLPVSRSPVLAHRGGAPLSGLGQESVLGHLLTAIPGLGARAGAHSPRRLAKALAADIALRDFLSDEVRRAGMTTDSGFRALAVRD